MHHSGDNHFELELTDGRYLLIGDHRASDGCRVTIHTDITDLRLREIALARQSELLSATINSIGEALVVFDNNFRLALWNEQRKSLRMLDNQGAGVGARY